MEVLLPYFFILNSIAFFFAGYDKYLAIKNKRRISENILFFLAFIGGSIGLLIAMLLFRHKTSKASFIIKFSTIVFAQILIFALKLFATYNPETITWFLVS